MASAAIMQKFFNVKDGTEAVIDTVVDAMKLYNNSRFRAQVDAIDKKLAGGARQTTNEPAEQENPNAVMRLRTLARHERTQSPDDRTKAAGDCYCNKGPVR
jgi:hypothetical protein